MSAYRIICAECDQVLYGWNKRDAKDAFHRHVLADHRPFFDSETVAASEHVRRD